MTTPSYDYMLEEPDYDDGEEPPADADVVEARDAYFDYIDTFEGRCSSENPLTFDEFYQHAVTRGVPAVTVAADASDDLPF